MSPPNQKVCETAKAAIRQMDDLIMTSGRLKDAYSQGVKCTHFLQENIPDLTTALQSQSYLDYSLNLYEQMKVCSEKMIYTIQRLKVAAGTGKPLLSPQTPPSAKPALSPTDPQHHLLLQHQKSQERWKHKQLQIERETNPTRKANMRLELARNKFDQDLELRNLKSKIDAQMSEQRLRLQEMIESRRERLKDRSISTKSENQEVIEQILRYDQTARDDESMRNLSKLSDSELTNLISNVLQHEPHPLTAHLTHHTEKYKRDIQHYINKYRQLLNPDQLQLALNPVIEAPRSEDDDLFDYVWGDETETPDIKNQNNISELVAELQHHNRENEVEYMKDIDGLLEVIYKIRDIFIFSYHKTDEPISDHADLLICKILEDKMFELIGDQISFLTRLLGYGEERTLFSTMRESSALTLSDFDGDDRLLCGTNGEFLQPIIDKITNLSQIKTPIRKLVSLGQIYEELNKTLQIQLSSQQINKTLGADDIMPVVSLVIVKSGLTQISAELKIIEHFLHSYFENGKEEYTFCTFLTAASALTQSPI